MVAVLVFGALAAVLYAPQFEGRALVMHDVVQYEGSARDIVAEREATGHVPHWTGASFAGMPSYFIYTGYSGHWAKYVFKAVEFMGRPASLIFVAMLAFFAMLLLMRVNPWAALAPSVAYGLSTYFIIIIAVGHIGKMVALAYAPLLIGAVWFTFRRRLWLGGALSALAGAVLLASNHPQIVYYFLLVVLALWVSELVRAVRKREVPRWLKATGVLVGAAALAVGANLAPLWYMQEYAGESTRGGSELATGVGEKGLDLEYATQWSYGVGETFNLFIPYLYGGSSEGNFSADGAVADALANYNQRRLAPDLPSYWGPQPMTSGPTYLGAGALFLAVLTMFALPRRWWLWLAAVSVVAVLLAWGNHFMWFTRLFFEWFPAYDKFRTVSMILVIVEFSVPLLGALMLMKLWRMGDSADIKAAPEVKTPDRKELLRALRNTTIVLGGIALFFLLFGGTVFDFSAATDAQMPDDIAAAMRTERASMMRSDALRSLFWVALCAGMTATFAIGKLRRGWLMAFFAMVMVADIAAVDARYNHHSDFVPKVQTQTRPTEADRQIMEDKEPGYRVFNLTVSPFNDATTSAFHRSVGGYSAVKLQRYQDVIDRYLSQGDPAVLGILNVKYVITPEGVMQNPGAMGSAWFVDEVVSKETAAAEIDALAEVDLSSTAVVREGRVAEDLDAAPFSRDSLADEHAPVAAIRLAEPPTEGVDPDSEANTIVLADYRPDYLKYEYTSATDATAVFSEIYYPHGWQAFVDGKPADHFRADYILRAMRLPAGEHTVEFRFEPERFGAVNGLTMLFSLIIVLAVAAAIVIPCKERTDSENDARQKTEK